MGSTHRAPTHRGRPPCPLDQEPLGVREEVRQEGGVREAGGPAGGPLWEAPQGQGRGWCGRALGRWLAFPRLGTAGRAPVCGQQVQVPAGVHDGVDDYRSGAKGEVFRGTPPRPHTPRVSHRVLGSQPQPPPTFQLLLHTPQFLQDGADLLEAKGRRPMAPKEPGHSGATSPRGSGQCPHRSLQPSGLGDSGPGRCLPVPSRPASPCWKSSGWAPRSRR